MTVDDVEALFRQLRKDRGVSQEAFAHAVRIDRSYSGSTELVERIVRLETVSNSTRLSAILAGGNAPNLTPGNEFVI